MKKKNAAKQSDSHRPIQPPPPPMVIQQYDYGHACRRVPPPRFPDSPPSSLVVAARSEHRPRVLQQYHHHAIARWLGLLLRRRMLISACLPCLSTCVSVCLPVSSAHYRRLFAGWVSQTLRVGSGRVRSGQGCDPTRESFKNLLTRADP